MSHQVIAVEIAVPTVRASARHSEKILATATPSAKIGDRLGCRPAVPIIGRGRRG
jgi:hypothetical protein